VRPHVGRRRRPRDGRVRKLPDQEATLLSARTGSTRSFVGTSLSRSANRFYSIASLPSSSSPSSRVILISDAAHALPPTGGQGAAMALEDASTFANALARLGVDKEDSNHISSLQLPGTPSKWQADRQKKELRRSPHSLFEAGTSGDQRPIA
jgi:2-polyprenyl-6-methoxyphenol hydroxylase-like FAD-dependent oxidoreductase